MDLTCTDEQAIATPRVTEDRGRLLAWIVPDMAMLLSLLTVVWCLLFFGGTQQFFHDSDSGWHIRTGEAILDGKGLPRVDTYSLTRSGRPWFAWEWGADVMMGAAHRVGGLAWVAGLYCVVLASCVWLWFRLNCVTGGHFLLACMLIFPLLSTLNIHLHARPHVFSWLMTVATILYFEQKRRSLIVVALLGATWANIHPSFFLVAVIAGIYAFSKFVEPLIWSGIDRRDSFSESRWYAAAALVALAASLLNPYGWTVHQHVFHYLGDRDLLSRISEFQTFNFHSEGAWQLILTMAFAAGGGAAALAARRPAHCLLIAMLLGMGIRSARTLPLVAIICLPLANGAITWVLRECQGLQPRLRKWIDAFLQYGANLRRLELRFRGFIPAVLTFVALAAVLRLPGVQRISGFPDKKFPVKAASEVARLPQDARILAPDMFGGYLIYRFAGERKVFVDGRSDFYGVDYMKDYLKLIEVRPGWRDQLAKTGFTHALAPSRSSLITALGGEGWKKLYSDEVATLLEAPAPANAPVTARR